MARGGSGLEGALEFELVNVESGIDVVVTLCSSRLPRATDVRDSRVGEVPNTPPLAAGQVRAAAGCSSHAAAAVPGRCGVARGQVRADEKCPTARGGGVSWEAVLALEQDIGSWEVVGVDGRRAARSPRATDVRGPRGRGVPNTPHTQTGRVRAEEACGGESSKLYSETRRPRAELLRPAQRGNGTAAHGAVTSSTTVLADFRVAEAAACAQFIAGALGRPMHHMR